MPFPDAFWTLTGYAALAAGAVLAVWALRGDRSRGRKRCPCCWYDMSGATGLTCPECGRAANAERALFKTRRRWRWAAAGLFVIVAGAVTTRTPHLLRDGWAAATPAPILRAIAWPFESQAAAVFQQHHSPAPAAVPNPATDWERVLLARHAISILRARLDPSGDTALRSQLGLALQELYANPIEAKIAMPEVEHLLGLPDTSWHERVDALDLLAIARGEDVLPHVLDAFDDPHRVVRTYAVDLVSQVVPRLDRVIEILLAAIKHRDADVRVAAANNLISFAHESSAARAALRDAEANDPSPLVQMTAELALNPIDGPCPDPHLLRQMPQEDRLPYARSVIESESPSIKYLPWLLALVSDPDAEIRLAAVEAIGVYAPLKRRTILLLRKTADEDVDERVRSAAAALLSGADAVE